MDHIEGVLRHGAPKTDTNQRSTSHFPDQEEKKGVFSLNPAQLRFSGGLNKKQLLENWGRGVDGPTAAGQSQLTSAVPR